MGDADNFPLRGGDCSFVGETSVKVSGAWHYVYSALRVEATGHRCCTSRLRQRIGDHGQPGEVVTDRAAALVKTQLFRPHERHIRRKTLSASWSRTSRRARRVPVRDCVEELCTKDRFRNLRGFADTSAGTYHRASHRDVCRVLWRGISAGRSPPLESDRYRQREVAQRYGSSSRRAAGNDLGMPQPVIIEVAINGSTTRAVNPNVPKSTDEIAAESLRCIEAGASIIHAHCDPVGGPDEEVAERYLAGFGPVWAHRPDALLYPTVNFGADGMSFGHLPILAAAGLRIGLLDPGSLNLGRLGVDGLPAGAFVYANSFERIRDVFELHRTHALGPSLAIYEPGFLRTALAYWRAGKLPAGTMIKLYLAEDHGLLGAPFGLPVSRAGLDAYLDILGHCDVPWAVSAVGGDIVRSDVGRIALERGGHLHIGLEFYGGDRTPTNLELVEEAVALCAEVGRTTASCTEAAGILSLPAAR